MLRCIPFNAYRLSPLAFELDTYGSLSKLSEEF